MYKTAGHKTGSITTTEPAVEGEPITKKVRRIMNNKEPIQDGVEMVYTDRTEGVRADTDIRTDRWEIAADAKDKTHKYNAAKREERHKAKKSPEGEEKSPNSGTAGNDATTGGGDLKPV